MAKKKTKVTGFKATTLYRVLIHIYNAMFAVFLRAIKLLKKIIQYFL